VNNLHRELAPISDAAWAQIEEEASRTLKRHLAARRVADVQGPKGVDFSAVGTGHIQQIATPGDGIQAAQREVKALVELRVPFELTRHAIDDVERGSVDSDWDTLKEAARRIAFAEDRAVFEGYAAGGIEGVRQGTSNPVLTLPATVKAYPAVLAQAISELRLAGVNGPQSCFGGKGARPSAGQRRWLPGPEHIRRLVDGEIVGSCHRRRLRSHDAWRRLRVGDRAGYLHRLPRSLAIRCRVVSTGRLSPSVCSPRRLP
jgi:uncharacterized linocin/CFP29 family protein